MSAFRSLLPHQLARLDDDGLLEYVRAARAAGATPAERDGTAYLAFAFEPTIRGWVRGSTPKEDVDDVVMEVLESAIRAAFGGKVLGEFGAFLKRIAQRRVADYWRRRERRPDADPLPSGHGGEDEPWGIEPAAGDETGAVALRAAVERVLAGLGPLHREVVRLYFGEMDGFEDLPAADVSARIAAGGSGERVSADNVAKIASRFRAALREELDG